MTVDLSSYKVANLELTSSTKFDNFVQAVESALNSIALSQIQNGGGADGQVAELSGGIWTPTTAAAAVTPTVYRKTTEKDVVNTAVATDLLNGEITVGAAVLGTTKMLRATLLGDYLNNSGATRQSNLRVKFGGTTLFDDTIDMQVSATRRPFRLVFEIANLGAANSQFMAGALSIGIAQAATTGVGRTDGVCNASSDVSAGAYEAPSFATNGTVAVDTTLAKALVVECQHPVANLNLSCRLKYAAAEVI